MILVADSGSTKTAWILMDGKHRKSFTTQGLNPYHTPAGTMRETLVNELLPQTGTDVSAIYFYGAGCTTAKIPEMRGVLAGLFPSAHIEVGSDLLGACRGLCGDTAGIVCILGTGSNSCLWDGRNIVANTPPLGYILGDEGSGEALGRAFVADCLKNQLPEELKEEFMSAFGMTQADIIERVYRQPMANRFLAGFAPFISSHCHIPQVRSLVLDEFRRFLRRNIAQYDAAGSAIHFTGSIARHFSELLGEAVRDEGFVAGTIAQSPIEGIAEYHSR